LELKDYNLGPEANLCLIIAESRLHALMLAHMHEKLAGWLNTERESIIMFMACMAGAKNMNQRLERAIAKQDELVTLISGLITEKETFNAERQVILSNKMERYKQYIELSKRCSRVAGTESRENTINSDDLPKKRSRKSANPRHLVVAQRNLE
jgi:hypothetical protein